MHEKGKLKIKELFSPQETEEINKKFKEDGYKMEEDIIKTIKEKIHLDASNKVENKRGTKGSLYDLFDSHFFSMHMLVCYLDKKEDTGIIDTLVNLLYKKYIHNSFNYLPQIW